MATEDKVFKREDPSLYYEMIEPIGNGASSKIFKVRRLMDDKLYAVKFMGAEDEFEKQMIVDEVSIIKYNPGDCIIRCQDAFFFRERYWVVLELLDASFANIIWQNSE
jgi:serine/threonine protein kinase